MREAGADYSNAWESSRDGLNNSLHLHQADKKFALLAIVCSKVDRAKNVMHRMVAGMTVTADPLLVVDMMIALERVAVKVIEDRNTAMVTLTTTLRRSSRTERRMH